ncbi:MAG: radical SAM protein [Promethearchaeota archaeon]
MAEIEVLRKTTSICPECMEAIEAKIVYDKTENMIKMQKNCKKHGDYEDKLSINPEFYIWKNGYADKLGSRIETAPQNIEKMPIKKGCPFDCGLCNKHKSAPNFMILDITNRCNLNCPVCFANSNKQGRIVEYTWEEVVRIMEFFINQRPYHAALAQFSGGEPTLWKDKKAGKDLVDLVLKAKELGFPHRMVNTNGILMAKNKDFCKRLKEAGLEAIYLSFDAIGPNSAEIYKKIRGVDLTNIKKKMIENCRETGLTGIMLVVTLVKGVNDGEVGYILDFARDNNDVVAGIVFQPVSLCGRITMEEVRQLRYTNSDLMAAIDRYSQGRIGKMFPLAMSSKLTQLLAWFQDLPEWAISAHDDCGWCTLVPIGPDGEWRKLEDYLEIEKAVKWANTVWEMVKKRELPKPSSILEPLKSLGENFGLSKLIEAVGDFSDKMSDIAYRNAMKAYFIAGLARYIKIPDSKSVLADAFYQNAIRLLFNPSLQTSKAMLLNKLMFVGSMHFQDAYNLDVERVSRCVVHYGVLDPNDPNHVLQIPFCTFNTIHRERIEKEWAKKYSKPLDKPIEEIAKETNAIINEISKNK